MNQDLIHPTDHLETLRRCGGYYVCPKDKQGRRLGPLVGYAGKYVTDMPFGNRILAQSKQYVGDIYASFAKTDEYPWVLEHYANSMGDLGLYGMDAFCGAPYGGHGFSQALGSAFKKPITKAEKKIVALPTPTSREKTELVFGRHGVEPGAKYAIVEDVCNNFSTTEQLISLITSLEGKVVAVVCLLNRSPLIDSSYSSPTLGCAIPVVSLVRKVIDEYKQDDPAVREDIEKDNVVWKPKDRWNFLMDQMKLNAS